MRKLLCVVVVLAITSSAMAATFTEDFEAYQGGSTTWNSGFVWNEPTENLKLDNFTPNGQAPRTGNSGFRWAHAELENSVLNAGEYGVAPIDFSALFYWEKAACKNDAFLVVLSDDPATAQTVPVDNTSTADPINAIAWGHSKTGGKNYSFFDGQNWTGVGYNTSTSGGSAYETVAGWIQPDGSWSAASSAGGSGGGTLAVSNFSFDTVSVISQGYGSGAYSGIDDITVSFEVIPEPSTLALLGLGLPLLLLLYRRRA